MERLYNSSTSFVIMLVALAFIIGCLMRFWDMGENSEPQLRFWGKPEPGDDLPAEAIYYMGTANACPFCHTGLKEGPRGGATQNFFCRNIVCNSRFNISRQPGHLPFGQYVGAVPDDILAEIEEERVAAVLLESVDRWPV